MALQDLSNDPHHTRADGEPEEAMLDPSEAAEEIPQDEDAMMHSDEDEDEGDDTGDQGMDEVELVNDSICYFDTHQDSIFTIAAHPKYPESFFVTGGGDDTAYLWAVPSEEENSGDNRVVPCEGRVVQKLAGHSDSVTSAGFSRPDGGFVATAGLDGRLQVWRNQDATGNVRKSKWELVGSVQEVEEINWLEWHPTDSNVLAVGASDGSVWIYDVTESEVIIRHALYSHTGSCTAGAWLPTDGSLLCTVSEDGSFYAWDLVEGRSLVGLTALDQRFEVEGGLVSIAINWEGTFAAVGGATGTCKVVSLPRSASSTTTTSSTSKKSKGGPSSSSSTAASSASSSTGGQILTTLQSHTQSVESLAFSRTLPLLATASVDGQIIIYDHSRQFTIRKTLSSAHSDAVVKVEFVNPKPNNNLPPAQAATAAILLTSCSTDGTIKRWDARSGNLLNTWKGHADGVLGFVQTERFVVTAGDDQVALVFDTSNPPSIPVGAAPEVAAAGTAIGTTATVAP